MKTRECEVEVDMTDAPQNEARKKISRGRDVRGKIKNKSFKVV